jgi:hypothetical protein
VHCIPLAFTVLLPLLAVALLLVLVLVLSLLAIALLLVALLAVALLLLAVGGLLLTTVGFLLVALLAVALLLLAVALFLLAVALLLVAVALLLAVARLLLAVALLAVAALLLAVALLVAVALVVVLVVARHGWMRVMMIVRICLGEDDKRKRRMDDRESSVGGKVEGGVALYRRLPCGHQLNPSIGTYCAAAWLGFLCSVCALNYYSIWQNRHGDARLSTQPSAYRCWLRYATNGCSACSGRKKQQWKCMEG